ncbi:hypothetical protein [Methylorubrum extorquens]
MRCPECRRETFLTWKDLDAAPSEEILSVAQRVRCQECGEAPAGLAVVTYREAA